MCGVSGMVRRSGTLPADTEIVTALNERQRHRGPDDAGRWIGENVVLGQTRLAVIDLTDGGHQPFVSPDGTISVVFNGEIYNHENLRRRYGLTTVNRCDGAILPELWTLLGCSMFAELRGMYAIAINDARAETLTLCRDVFGIKPLYWTQTVDGALAFASEPRPLLDLVPRPRLNASALEHFLSFGAMSGAQSPFEDVVSLAPNSWVQWDHHMTRTTGPVVADPFDRLPRANESELREEFLRSVSLHLRSDVPVALLLSSGIDSVAVAWACAELGTDLLCITADMSEGMAEQAGARRVAARFGHTHEVVSAEPDGETVRRYFSAMQKPSIDGLNTFLVSRSIADLGVKVALSGLGGDELLAGYASFRVLPWLRLLRFADAAQLLRPLGRLYRGRNEKLAQLLRAHGPRDAVGLERLCRRIFMDQQVEALAPWRAAGAVPAVTCRGSASALAMSLAEIERYLGGTLLPDTDAFSMASSVEMRLPYVDVPFARRALAVAPKFGIGKKRFAAAIGDRFLREVARDRKRGFTLPMDAWMRHGALAALVRAAGSPDAPVRELLAPSAVDGVLRAWRDGRLGWSRAWLMVSLDAWLRDLRRTGVDVALAPDVTGTRSPADRPALANTMRNR